MTYIPKKTLYIRHENVVSGTQYNYNRGRWWFGTDSQISTKESFSIGTVKTGSFGFYNLTGTRYEENKFDLYDTPAGYSVTTWGLKAGVFMLEYEIMVSLSSTASPTDMRVHVQNHFNNSADYSPQFPISSHTSPSASNNPYSWTDTIENGVNYRCYKMKKKFTSQGRLGVSSANKNLRFSHLTATNTHIIEHIYEDIKITKLD